MVSSFEAQRENVIEALRRVAGAVDRKSGSDAKTQSTVLIRMSAEGMRVIASDHDLEIACQIPLMNVVGEGEFLICFRKLLDVCRAFPDKACIRIQQKEGTLELISDRIRYTLSITTAQDFPLFSVMPESATALSVPQGQLRKFIENAHFAMADQDVRLYLNGMLFEFTGSDLCAVASDGHRLALSVMPLCQAQPVQKPLRVLVPKKTVHEWLRILDNDESTVILQFGEKQVCLIGGEFEVRSRLIDAEFPEYQRLIPEEDITQISADRQVLKEAFQRVSALFSDRFRAVRLRFSSHRLILSAATTEQDQFEEDLDVEYQGEPFEIVFNVRYLMDCLQALHSARVRWLFSGLNRSAKIQGEGEKGVIYVVMPMRV